MYRTRLPHPLALLIALLAPAAADAADKPTGLDVELEDLRPGLVATYRSIGDRDASVTRIEPKPAFYIGHSSPHPRIGLGPFEVVWQGVLFLKETSPVSFDALAGGEVSVEVDGVAVLQGRGATDTAKIAAKQALDRPPGFYRLKIQYRSLPDVPARLQVWWHGPSFSREPLPPWQLKHLAADVSDAVKRDELSEVGRKASARFGCARCHASAFPGSADAPPGPSLADARGRIARPWLLQWLAEPVKVRADAHMPALFSDDRTGFVERWLVADFLLGSETDKARESKAVDPGKGDHRTGRETFILLGCTACHLVPDLGPREQKDLDRYPLVGLGDRLKAADLTSFLGNPHSRYPDGRMPRLPVTPEAARDITSYLLLWSRPAELPDVKAPSGEEIDAVARRLKVRGAANAAAALVREKRCNQCHSGLGTTQAEDVPITDKGRGCLSGKTGPRYHLDAATAKSVAGYLAVGAREQHASPFESRRRLLERAGCARCHQRDHDRPPPLEEAGSALGGARLQYVPFQRTPKLTNPHQKYHRAYLARAVREGVSGLRPARFSYRMPAFGADAETLLQAIAESDGELPAEADAPQRLPTDPTLGTLGGPSLAGFAGYGCVSCHVWNGQTLGDPDPGAVGPDLTKVKGRIRREWFDRFLEDPARVHPGTPMPSIMQKGKPAMLTSVLDGDPDKQRDALWAYFALGKDAPSPKPPPALIVSAPEPGEAPLVAQVPIRLPSGTPVESISILFGSSDLLIYDVGAAAPHSVFTGAQVLRNIQGRMRSYTAAGNLVGNLSADKPLQLVSGDKAETPKSRTLHAYDRLADGARIRWRIEFPAAAVELAETLRIAADGDRRRLLRTLEFRDIPDAHQLVIRSRPLPALASDVQANVGKAEGKTVEGIFEARLTPDKEHRASASLRTELPAAKPAPPVEKARVTDAGKIEGSLERPGYRAIAYPRPKTATGDDRVMPGAIAVHPRDGRVFIASLKTGEIFVLHDPSGDGKQARFENYGHGLFQDALSMRCEDDGLYVLHRRNLTKILESKHDGRADRFERVFALPHGIADTYDYGYGLVRDRTGAFVVSYAPHANRNLPGSGGLVRLLPGKAPQELAFGFRNPIGWCNGPEGEVFFTDNQGEWVATNKLCHIVEGRYYGYPNLSQKEHAKKPFAKPTVWVPYGWARSINGVTYDDTRGKFGPFAGQFFMAELMFGGAIIRANVEKVNGSYQGACFPFWEKGLLGPLTLAFDPRGRLFVGGITEPGWMAQPDRGALFRIDFTGQTPFEMQSLHVRPRGFKVVFTSPVDAKTAGDPASYQVEHYRYEYTGAYGSPELERTRVPIERIAVAEDGRSAELTTAALVKDRVYLITAAGVRSKKGEKLVHLTGAYTLNEIPGENK